MYTTTRYDDNDIRKEKREGKSTRGEGIATRMGYLTYEKRNYIAFKPRTNDTNNSLKM